ncbi:aldo/keto reductase [Arsenicitalea aurantiaca]|uniref:Aldo/keto reductase n=1 Tax=Arsenicitalea aurantiaca TaxID=1783274 RepID=A0A433XGC3_9HYPH|nr:aldo/keto reductase [Arsenicitalea aurantiaca]RUT33110.1 aldo/keto reductase [Arsenicitalea aurantiaca]
MADRTFEKRRIAETDLEITTLGLGGATLAGIFKPTDEMESRATITRALEEGITYFDTAPQYGYGRSEHMMGNALRGKRSGTVLSTKVGRLLRPIASEADRQYPHNWVDPLPFEQVYDYTYDAIMRSFEDSQQRLGLDKIDILYVHDIGVMTHGEEENARLWGQLADSGYRALRELRESGVIGAIGLGVNEWEVLMDAFALGDWDVFLLAGRYTLLEQTSLNPFLSTCIERKASVVCGGPFNGGALMGAGVWNYAKAPQHIIDRVKALEAFCAERKVSLGAAALQFPLAHPAVCNVLPGPRTVSELEGILEWWHEKIPAEFWAELASSGLVAEGTPLPGGVVAE